jgi:hypothetical protein
LYTLLHRLSWLILVFCTFGPGVHLVEAQVFNPYQHSYQGWDGNKIRRSHVRAFLNRFTLSVSSGYGRTFYAHEVEADLLESVDEQIMLSEYTLTGTTINYKGVQHWLNAPRTVEGTRTLGADRRLVGLDTANIGYRGSFGGVPIEVSLTFDINRFRIGAGVSAELHHTAALPALHSGGFPYASNAGSTMFTRYFLTMSAFVYNVKGWMYHAELQIGKLNYGSKFDKSSLRSGLYFNIGFPIEYEFSEYLRVFVKPSFDVKNYTMVLPGVEGGSLPSAIQHSQSAVYLQVGIRLKLAEVPRCPIPSCRTQLKHVHGNQEYRGQPFYKKQSPKIGELDGGPFK